jgi:hypothetical protein
MALIVPDLRLFHPLCVGLIEDAEDLGIDWGSQKAGDPDARLRDSAASVSPIRRISTLML